MPAVELVAHVRRLPRFHLEERWGYHEENTARLLEQIAAWLGYEWAGWTTDPDDPEFRRAQAERRRAGITPAPDPLIPPAALRPPTEAKARRAVYDADLARHADGRERRMVTSDEFDLLLDL